MTENQQEDIKALRHSGLGYKKIAAALSMSENTVKSYCIRNKLKAGNSQNVCLQCQKAIEQPLEKTKKSSAQMPVALNGGTITQG